MKYTLKEHFFRAFKSPVERAIQDNLKADPGFQSKLDRAVEIMQGDLVLFNKGFAARLGGGDLDVSREGALEQLVDLARQYKLSDDKPYPLAEAIALKVNNVVRDGRRFKNVQDVHDGVQTHYTLRALGVN